MNKKNTDFKGKLNKIKSYLESKNIDYYDIRFEDNYSTAISIENKTIKNIKENNTNGIGIRIYHEEKLGFCSTNNLDDYKTIIDNCIEQTKKSNKKIKMNEFAQNKAKCKLKYKDFLDKDIKIKSKELLKINTDFIKNNKDLKNYKILQSNLSYLETVRKKYFINPYSNIYQEDPHIIMYSSLTGKRNNIIENSLNRIGFLGGLEQISYLDKENLVNTNKKKLEDLLYSKPCPATISDIIITPEISDLLAHEAIGHAAEADAVINDSSILKIGQTISKNENINIIDDPTKKEFGYYKYDDEGIKATPRNIIKKGVVNEYLLDIESASKLGFKSNGASRSESYNKLPIVRMSNTYFKEGKEKYKDMSDNFNGYLLDGFAGGQVDPSVGTFMFGIKHAYKIKNGEILEKYKQASISGNILDYLKNITSLSNKIGDFSFGFCGKGGQKAFVSGSGPYIKIKNTTLGGTKHE